MEERNTLIIGLVGQMVTGKGTAAEYLNKKYGALNYRFSDPLRDILDRMHTEKTRNNLQKLSTVLRQNFGEDVLAKIIKEDIKNSNYSIATVDGIRRWGDIELIKNAGNFVLTAIETSPEKRYERMIKRKENEGDEKKTYEEFLSDQQKEADAQIPQIMQEAQEKISNEDGFDDFYKQLDNIIKKYGDK